MHKTESSLLLGSSDTDSSESGIHDLLTTEGESERTNDTENQFSSQEADITQNEGIADIDLQDQTENGKTLKKNEEDNKFSFTKLACTYVMLNFMTMLTVYLHKHKSFQNNVIKMLYKAGLPFYFLITFLYSLIVLVVKGEHTGFYVVYIIFSCIGLLFELFYTSVDLYQYAAKKTHSATLKYHEEIDEELEQEKQKSIQKSNISIDLGIMMIYPCVVRSVYGFVNEKSWMFSSTLGGFNFVILMASVIMQLVYEQSNIIWLAYTTAATHFQKSIVICAVAVFSSLYIAMQWITLAATGVRVYADNFARKNITVNLEIATEKFESATITGDYNSTPGTRCLLFAANFLPILLLLCTTFFNSFMKPIQLKSLLTRKLYDILMNGKENFDAKRIHMIMMYSYYCILIMLWLIWWAVIIIYSSSIEYRDPKEYKLSTHARNASRVLSFFFVGFTPMAVLFAGCTLQYKLSSKKGVDGDHELDIPYKHLETSF